MNWPCCYWKKSLAEIAIHACVNIDPVPTAAGAVLTLACQTFRKQCKDRALALTSKPSCKVFADERFWRTAEIGCSRLFRATPK